MKIQLKSNLTLDCDPDVDGTPVKMPVVVIADATKHEDGVVIVNSIVSVQGGGKEFRDVLGSDSDRLMREIAIDHKAQLILNDTFGLGSYSPK